MPHLYELNQDYRNLLDAIENGEIPEEAIADTLESIEGDIEYKIDQISLYIKEQESLKESIEARAKEMLERAKAIENKNAGYKSYLATCLNQYLQMNPTQKKYENEFNKIYFSKSKSTQIADTDAFIQKAYEQGWDCISIKTTATVDKTKVKKMIESGFDFGGMATIEEKQNLQIK